MQCKIEFNLYVSSLQSPRTTYQGEFQYIVVSALADGHYFWSKMFVCCLGFVNALLNFKTQESTDITRHYIRPVHDTNCVSGEK